MISILAAAAAVFAVGAPTASAASTAALPYCWGATYGGTTAQVCAANTTWIGGTMFDPGLRTDCIIRTNLVATDAAIAPVVTHPCQIVGNVVTGIDDTGLADWNVSTPYPSGASVRLNATDWAVLVVDGKSYTIHTEALCVGGGCPTSLAQALNLVQVK